MRSVARPISKFARNAALLSFAASAAFILCLGALHVLRTDLDPSWRFISEYEIGHYGWVMRLAFFALALSCASLCVAIVSQIRTIAGYLGLALLVLSAIGMIVAGIFAPGRVSGLHEVGAMLDSVPFAALLMSWSLSRNGAWLPVWRTLAWTAGIPLLGLVIFLLSLAVMLRRNGGQPGPEVLAGWPNRIMILAHCAWLMPVAWLTAASTREQTSGRVNIGGVGR
ncbi:Protein of unknown function [Rhizobiales bacterium GAS113]|jgi:hypothetical protein|nr:Protein of unknown function [Rhizobiales bacterium GAS113]